MIFLSHLFVTLFSYYTAMKCQDESSGLQYCMEPGTRINGILIKTEEMKIGNTFFFSKRYTVYGTIRTDLSTIP